MQPRLEAMAAEMGLRAQITFTGRLPHRDVVAHIAAMDIGVSPRATFYASPMKLLEYMAMRTAVVAPAMDNVRDVLEPDITGVLFDVDSLASLTAALRRLVCDGELRERLGNAARRRIVEERTWRHNARTIVEECGALLSSSSTIGRVGLT